MKGYPVVFLALFFMVFGGKAYAEDIPFVLDQGGVPWSFTLEGNGVASVGEDETTIVLPELKIVNNSPFEKKQWIDYISLGFAYRNGDGLYGVSKADTVMINKILNFEEVYVFNKPLSVTLKIPKNQLRNHWVVVTLGSNDKSTVNASSAIDIFQFGVAVDGEDVVNELELRARVSQASVTAFMNRDFSQLSGYANQYLAEETKTPSGLWLLTLHDVAIINAITEEAKSTGEWDGVEKRALEWIDFDPNSPAAYVTYAQSLVYRAWSYKKGNTHIPGIIRVGLFNYYTKKAEWFLEDNKEVASKDPRWYEAMLLVARAQEWDMESYTRLEREGFEKFPYYYQMYFTAFDYHSPAWGGDSKEIERFAKMAISYTAEKDKTGMYARIYWYASQRYYGSEIFTESDVAWGKMSRSIDDVLAQYPDQWNINNFAYFSCLAGDAGKTKRLVSRVAPGPLTSVWGNMEFYERCKVWSEAAQIN
jgi:hypothetical protein